MSEKDTRKQVYEKIYTIISDDDNFPAQQAENLAGLARSDGRLFSVFYLLIIAMRVYYWRRAGTLLRKDAENYEDNAGMLEELNTN